MIKEQKSILSKGETMKPKTHSKKFHFEYQSQTYGGKVTLDKVVPKIKVGRLKNLSYDFIAAVCEMLEIKERHWKMKDFRVSKHIPERVLHNLYDGMMVYIGNRFNKFPNSFNYLSAERITLRNLANMPEVMVNHRYFLGIVDEMGNIKIIDRNKDEVNLEVQDPYDRFFALQNVKTIDNIKKAKHPVQELKIKGRKTVQITSKNGHPHLTFKKKMNSIIKDEDDSINQWIYKMYRYVRIPEYHAGRKSDNIIFEVDDYLKNLFKVMNYLFEEQLDWPFYQKERGPFRIPTFWLSASQPLGKGKVLLSTEPVLMYSPAAEKYYR